ncbi:MAG: ATP-binding cassette domain-containing protein [Acetobacteraceae bacterium]|nr:ATP-binding cassette domain-containing protein [Acetobacteraceae bacterium]
MEQNAMPLLRLEAVTRRALTRPVLDRVTLEVAAGECLALLGEAGSGRASLLRIIAGREEPDAGRVLLDGADITRLPARRRPIAHLVQHDPLFGHATVFDTVASALPEDADGAATPAARVQQLLGLVGLAEDAGAMPVMLPPGKRSPT